MDCKLEFIRLELLKCAENPAPVNALAKWWDKHICEFGQTTSISNEYIKHLKDDFTNYKAHQDKAAAYKIGEALYETNAIHREQEQHWAEHRESHRVYVVVTDSKKLNKAKVSSDK